MKRFILVILAICAPVAACSAMTTPCVEATSTSGTSGPGGGTASSSSTSGTGGGTPLGDGGPMKLPTCVTAADCPASLASNTCNGVLCDPQGAYTQPGSPLLGCYLVTLLGKACDTTVCPFPLGICDMTSACVCPDYCTCAADPSGAPDNAACGSTACYAGNVWTCISSVWTQSAVPCDGGA